MLDSRVRWQRFYIDIKIERIAKARWLRGGVSLGYNSYNEQFYFAQQGRPETEGSRQNIDQDNFLSLQLSTDKDFRKHRNRVAYLSLFYNWAAGTISTCSSCAQNLQEGGQSCSSPSALLRPSCLPARGPERGKELITTMWENKDQFRMFSLPVLVCCIHTYVDGVPVACSVRWQILQITYLSVWIVSTGFK